MRIKILIGLVFGLAFFSFCFYFFLLPPKAIGANFAGHNVSSTPLVINFDRPVDRQKLNPKITPEAYGEWSFTDPLVKNHLFRSLVFTPAVEFEPDTQYRVELDNVTNPFGVGFSSSFNFDFKTLAAAPDKENNLQGSVEPRIVILDIPLDWQDYSLSCEAASLKMALGYKGVYLSEDDIMGEIGYGYPLDREDDLWADPDKGYVGDINGKICETGYGVYWEPVAWAANNWRPAEAFSGWGLEDLTREIDNGNSVVVWGTLPVSTLTDCSWQTPEGKYVKAFKEAHVRLVVGYIGNADNPSKIIINDPLSGILYWPSSFFLTNWEAFGYSGVVVK